MALMVDRDAHTGANAQPDALSLPWMMAGLVMFAMAIGAPAALFHLQGGNGPSNEDAFSGKPVATASREARAPSGTVPEQEPLRVLLEDGLITPGVGIGPVLLDTDVRDVLARVREPSTLSYAVGDAGVEGTHELHGEEFDLTILAEPGIGAINSVTLSAHDCLALRDSQLRDSGFPATGEGLTLGSHVSRVRRSLGAPDAQSPAAGDPRRVAHTYPGMQLSYCVDNMLVGGIRVERFPPAPMLADNRLEVAPDADQDPSVAISAGLGDLVESPEAPQMALISPPTEIAPAPWSGSLAVRPLTGAKSPADAPITAAPDTLLAMNGGAFTAGDAFKAPRQPRDGRIFARTTVPSELVMAVVRASVAQETNAEFEGVDAFLVSQAANTETGLNLSRRARVQIQRRLQLIGYDPKGVDGIFGPNTRKVIAAMQADRGLPGTGFLDNELVASLKQESEPGFRAWQREVRSAQRRKALAAKRRAQARVLAAAKTRQRSPRANIVAARVPAARNAPECARDVTGKIISNQSWSCDVTVLEESLDALFSGRS